jgi:hypothetical protein
VSILPSQCRTARALIDMYKVTLARRAVVPRDALADLRLASGT